MKTLCQLWIVSLITTTSCFSSAMLFKKNRSAKTTAPTTTSRKTMAARIFSSPRNYDAPATESQALDSIKLCVKTTAVAAVVDIFVNTVGTSQPLRDFFQTPVGVVTGVWIVWKVVFAANLWRVCSLLEINPVLDGRKQGMVDRVETILKSMTSVWRVGALAVSATVTLNMMAIYQHHLPRIQHRVVGVFVVALLVSGVLHSRQTSDLRVSLSTENSDATRIRHRGLVTARAMAVTSAALFLQTAFIPIMALGQDTWLGSLKILSNIPTPLGIATLLLPLRRSFLRTLSETTETGRELSATSEDTKTLLSTAQVKFYGEIQRTIRKELLTKMLLFSVQAVRRVQQS